MFSGPEPYVAGQECGRNYSSGRPTFYSVFIEYEKHMSSRSEKSSSARKYDYKFGVQHHSASGVHYASLFLCLNNFVYEGCWSYCHYSRVPTHLMSDEVFIYRICRLFVWSKQSPTVFESTAWWLNLNALAPAEKRSKAFGDRDCGAHNSQEREIRASSIMRNSRGQKSCSDNGLCDFRGLWRQPRIERNWAIGAETLFRLRLLESEPRWIEVTAEP